MVAFLSRRAIKRIELLAIWLVVIVYCGFAIGQETIKDDRDTVAIAQVSELLDIFLENALSFRNYDLVVQKSTMFEPMEKNSKALPFVSVFNMRIAMDWDKERCLMVRHNYNEDPKSHSQRDESWSCMRFENGVKSTKFLDYATRPKVENMEFHRFLQESSVPLVEIVGIRMFPAPFLLPFDQAVAKAKETMTNVSFRRLPDGTGVRTVKNSGATTTLHFDAKTQMPVSAALIPEGRHPPLSNDFTYETIQGVYRPTLIVTRESTFYVDKNTSPTGKDIEFMTGVGSIKYFWKSFNESEPQLPDDSVLTNARDSWLKFIATD